MNPSAFSSWLDRAREAIGRILHALRPGEGTDWRATALTALMIVIGPTLAYKYISDRFGFVGSWFNVDFIIVYILMLVGARTGLRWITRLAYVGLAASFAVQVLVGIGVIYLVDPVLVADYLAFASYWPWGEILKWLGLGSIGLLLIYLLVRRVPMGKAHLWPVVLAGLALVGAERLGGDSLARYKLGVNVATSGARSLIHLVDAWVNYEGFKFEHLTTPSMDAIVSTMSEAERPDHILSISVEALGRFQDDSQNQAMFASLVKAAGDTYAVSFDKRLYKGATLSGELRALCGIRALGAPSRETIKQIAPGCLPHRLAKAGYATLGMHGNTGYFYNRREIYPGIGFQKAMFLDDFHALYRGKEMCTDNTFAGVCDNVALAEGLKFSAEHKRSFVHLMTIQTHFPLNESSLGTKQCGQIGTFTEPELCLYANSMSTLLGQLVAQIVAAPNPPELVYIFGDHGPPYAVADLRAKFDPHHVPFITLTRKRTNQGR